MSENKSAFEQIKAGLEDAKVYKAGDTSRARPTPVPTEELKPLPCPFEEWFDEAYPDMKEGGAFFELRDTFIGVAQKAWDAALTRSPAWRDDMENVPDSDKRVMFWRSKLKRVIICRADDYWAKPRPHWFDDVTHWQLPLSPEEKA